MSLFTLLAYSSFVTSAIAQVTVVTEPLIVTLSETPSCAASCHVWAETQLTEYRWQSATVDTFTVTATIVTIINTVRDTTRTSTRYDIEPGPSVPVNEDGTRVSAVTWMRSGKTTSTLIAFPTAFWEWPDDYTWSGTLPVATGQSTLCETAPSPGSVLPLPSFPQPGDNGVNPSDPEGMQSILWPRTVPIPHEADFSGHPQLQLCDPDPYSAPEEMVGQMTTGFEYVSMTEYEEDQPTTSTSLTPMAHPTLESARNTTSKIYSEDEPVETEAQSASTAAPSSDSSSTIFIPLSETPGATHGPDTSSGRALNANHTLGRLLSFLSALVVLFTSAS